MVLQQKFEHGKASEQVIATPITVYRNMTPQTLIVELRRVTLELKQTEKQMRASARAIHSPKLRRICSALHREKRHIENELAARGDADDGLDQFLECVEIDLAEVTTSKGTLNQLLAVDPDDPMVVTLREAHERREKLNPGHSCTVTAVCNFNHRS